jgi:serine/threonine protein kinase
LLQGSLRQALNQGRLSDPSSSNSLPALHLVLALAHDVACAMLHLHSEHLIHADLKASNVLLTHGNPHMLTTASSTASRGSATELLSPGSVATQQQQLLHQQEFGAGFVGSDMSCAALLTASQAKAGGRFIAKVSVVACLRCLAGVEPRHLCRVHSKDQPRPLTESSL